MSADGPDKPPEAMSFGEMRDMARASLERNFEFVGRLRRKPEAEADAGPFSYMVPNEAKPTKGVQSFPLFNPGRWADRDPPPRLWALAHHLPRGETGLLTAPGGSKKSLFLQQLSTCIAAAHKFMGLETMTAIALFVTAEDDAAELERRQHSICRVLAIDQAGLSGKLILSSLRGRVHNELAIFDDRNRLHVASAFDELRATITATGAQFVGLDNLAHFFMGNENDRGQATAFLNLLNGLAQDTGATILLAAHPPKGGATYSGSTAWLNATRVQLTIDSPETNDPELHRLVIGKANYSDRGNGIAFHWRDGALVRDDELPPNNPAALAAVAADSEANEVFRACLRKTTEEKRAVSPSPSASNYAPRVFSRMPTAKKLSLERLEGAMQRLLHLGEILGGQPIYQRPNRTWAPGLGFAQTLHKPAAQTRTGPPNKSLEDMHRGAQSLHTPRTPSPIEDRMRGLGTEGPAPLPSPDSDESGEP